MASMLQLRISDIVRNLHGDKKLTPEDVQAEYEKRHGNIFGGRLKDNIGRAPGVHVTKGKEVQWIGTSAAPNEHTLQSHMNGENHKKKIDDTENGNYEGNRFHCKICGVEATSQKNLQMHINGKKHKLNVAAANENKSVPAPANGQIPNPIENEILPQISTASKTMSKTKMNGKRGTADVKIAVHDTAADMVTFKESVGGKISSKHTDEEVAESLTLGLESMDLDGAGQPNLTVDEVASALFTHEATSKGIFQASKGLSLFGNHTISEQPEGALLGHLFPSTPSERVGEAVYLNTHEPFCLATVGVQGAGKSHTTSCILESCLVPFEPSNIVKLNSPMLTMVLHYDQNISSICEAAGLLSPNPTVQAKMKCFGRTVNGVPKDKAVILVSPAFYRQRKAFYGDYCTVKPLLFRWRSLTADHIKRIMRIESGDNQLYVASFLDLLRSYQRKAVVPEFSDFLNQVRSVCNANGQQGPLGQRVALLESVVAESEKNESLVEESLDLITCSKEDYQFIITDLTDPLLSKEEANGLFQVLTEQFRTLPRKGGKVLCLDEAHKYMTGEKADGLSEAIVNVARLMRHDGVRLIVSTQSPKALAPELLELVTVAVLHHFHSPDWWEYLRGKLPLHADAFERILGLGRGEAVAFATSHDFLSLENVEGSHCLPIRIRPRITEDLGSSRRNR